MNTTASNILWTATDFALPGEVWKYLEGQALKVFVSDKGSDIKERIRSLSPRLWVEQINGDSRSTFDNVKDIRENYPNLPVVLVAIQSNVEDAVEAIKLGVNDYVSINDSTEKLLAVIENALRGNYIVNSPLPKLKTVSGKGKMIASHPSMIRLMETAKKIAPSRSTILLNGETGVGKEVMARFIHENSDRKGGPFIAVNCAALPENLLDRKSVV